MLGFPDPQGKVILKTTLGDLEIELWTRECPKTTRNFLQLCMEGYYDNTIFFRMTKGFILQCGDPDGTGNGGESIYGPEGFDDEFHQRIKFLHRGIVGMNHNKNNKNGSQFFFTFDKTEFLDKKYTIFGRVVGDTIFNLLAFQNLEIDLNDRPLNPPVLLSAIIVVNPFDDMVPRQLIKRKAVPVVEEKKITKIQQNKKVIKNKALLSFEDEENDDSDGLHESHQGISAHDVLNDPKLKKEKAVSTQFFEKLQEEAEKEKRAIQMKERIGQLETNTHNQDVSVAIQKNIKNEQFNLNLERLKTLYNNEELSQMKVVRDSHTGKIEILFDDKKAGNFEEQAKNNDYDGVNMKDTKSNESDEKSYDDEELFQRQKQIEEYEKLKLDLLQFKKNKEGSLKLERKKKDDEHLKTMTLIEAKRAQYSQKKKVFDKEVIKLEKLGQFKKKINSNFVRSDEDNWMNNDLKFHIDSANAFSHAEKKNAMDESIKNAHLQMQQINVIAGHQNNFENSENKESWKKIISKEILDSIGLNMDYKKNE